MKKRGISVTQMILWLILVCCLFLTMIPVAMTVVMSFKNNAQIYTNFWALPSPWIWQNFVTAWQTMRGYIFNSLMVCFPSVLAVVFLSSLSGYVFARHRFPGKEIVFYMVLILLMIPSILTLIPAYALVKHLGLLNTRWVLILPWTAGGQVFGILLCRTFFATIPEELFEAARIDGASEFQLYYKIAVPLSYPIMITLGIMHMVGTYNDYIWPLVTISSNEKQVITVGVTQFITQYGIIAYGPQLAGYLLASLPLVVTFIFGMKYFIQGLTAGALKL